MIEEIKVGGVNYKVVFPHKFEDPLCVGLHTPRDSIIHIADTIQGLTRKPSMLYRTLLHEIFHAIDIQYCNSSIDEKIIDMLSKGWYNIIKDNNLFGLKSLNIINIFGINYKVIYDYDFKDMEASFATNNEKLEITIAECEEQYRLNALIVAIQILLCDDLEIEFEEYYNTFGNGVYQVFIDSDLDKDIRKGKV